VWRCRFRVGEKWYETARRFRVFFGCTKSHFVFHVGFVQHKSEFDLGFVRNHRRFRFRHVGFVHIRTGLRTGTTSTMGSGTGTGTLKV
jgi:hypothetical protein